MRQVLLNERSRYLEYMQDTRLLTIAEHERQIHEVIGKRAMRRLPLDLDDRAYSQLNEMRQVLCVGQIPQVEVRHNLVGRLLHE